MGGWGQVDPNFYKSLFFMAHLTPFLTKISGKFSLKVPTIWNLGRGWVSQVWVNCPKFYRVSKLYWCWSIKYSLHPLRIWARQRARHRRGLEGKGLLSGLEVGWRWGLGVIEWPGRRGLGGLVTTCTYPVTRPAIHGGPSLLRTAKALISSRTEQTFITNDYKPVANKGLSERPPVS